MFIVHLTVRMAWHDNNWNGRICQNPVKNTYCVGTHSLLADRIATNRDTELEQQYQNEQVADLPQGYSVPCYWSINAFSKSSFDITHRHAFSSINHTIKEKVKPYSVFTWPFKLSFVHSWDNKQRYGNYPPDLEQRVDHFLDKFTPNQSIIFFYSNYDNPISGDDMQYLLLGCSVVAERPEKTYFPLSEDELNDWRSKGHNMKHFPAINWSLQFTHLFEEYGVLLPYKEYLNYVEKNPDDEEKLDEMKVTIHENTLTSSFKYVAMDVDDDKCLYLLYKLRKSLLNIEEHGYIVNQDKVKDQLHKVERLIEMTWKKRGLYPSLSKIFQYFDMEKESADAISIWVEKNKNLAKLFEELKEEIVPDDLVEYEDDLLDMFEQRLFHRNLELIKNLSMIQLTDYQIKKILSKGNTYQSIGTNPYELYENYKADENDLDQPDLQDEPIDIYKIDIGFFPDRKFVKKDRKIQSYKVDCPERLRAVIIQYLYKIGESFGDCYDVDVNILHELKQYPLFYKTDIKIDDQSIIELDPEYEEHFRLRLHMEVHDSQRFYYLKETKEAERLVKKVFKELINREDYVVNLNFRNYISESLKKLVGIDEKLFTDERNKLYDYVLKKSLYFLTGKAGSGKTQETTKIIRTLAEELNQEVVVLAPTGKAALRLGEKLKENYSHLNIQPQTIERFLFRHGLGHIILENDYSRIFTIKNEDKVVVENLIIDESSMIDLFKFAMILSVIKMEKVKRILLVGDPFQLPPIGFGKPFRDLIDMTKKKELTRKQHFIRLESNCRMVQQNGTNELNKTLELAEIFTEDTKFYEPILTEVDKKEYDSETLYVRKWSSADELQSAIDEVLQDLIMGDKVEGVDEKYKAMNKQLGLYEKGYVPNNNPKALRLDHNQIISPYRTGYSGTISMNKFVQTNWRIPNPSYWKESIFVNGDKIIRLNNWYRRKELFLSNGSMGLVNVSKRGFTKKYFFKDLDDGMTWVDDEENFDLAYAISVHKSQGSDFEFVLFILPKKYSLLSKELVYTGLTRAKKKMFLFIQDEQSESLLELAKKISAIDNRNTSIFQKPMDMKTKLQPQKGVFAKSKVEYIIYKSLEQSGLQFKYEQPLILPNESFNIKPDFTITLSDGTKYYWEHLGLLDTQSYYDSWQKRKQIYEKMKLSDYLITTDDLQGIKESRINEIILDLKERNLQKTESSKLSDYHYSLFGKTSV